MSARKRKRQIDARQIRWAKWHLSMPDWFYDAPPIDLRELATSMYKAMRLIDEAIA